MGNNLIPFQKHNQPSHQLKAKLFLHRHPDEATAYADAENESKIQQAFARLAANKTVLVIAHRLQSICNADQIIVLDNGTISEREHITNC